MSYCKWQYLDGIRGFSGLGNAADLVESLRPRSPIVPSAPLCTCPPMYVRPALRNAIGSVDEGGGSTLQLVGVAVAALSVGVFFAWLGSI